MAPLRGLAYLLGGLVGIVVTLVSLAMASFGLVLGLVVATALLWFPPLLAWGIDAGLRHLGLWSNFWLVLAAVVVLLLMAVPKQNKSASVSADSSRSGGRRDEDL